MSVLTELMRRWKKEPPPIRSLQVEVSTLCQLACLYCPRTVAGARWPGRVMAWELYEKLAADFGLFETVFLQGWGEPLTNPRFWDMVALAKDKGRKVGFTTNGILFDAAAAERAVRLGVDIVTFTFAGAAAATHQTYRAGADFAALLDTVRLLAATRKKLQAAKPVISITYTMMRGNAGELPAAALLAAGVGADQMTCGHLDCILDPALEAHALFLRPDADDEHYLVAAAAQARQAGLVFDAEPPRMGGEILVCEPYPLRVTVFVRADGIVVPCHMMALPPAVGRLYFRGRPYANEPLVLGDLAAEPLAAILENAACGQLRSIFTARSAPEVSAGAAIPDAPAFCTTCYKLYGV
jgi:MoaA/NifB/PqqE/SkfB family radical SAM enzyme